VQFLRLCITFELNRGERRWLKMDSQKWVDQAAQKIRVNRENPKLDKEKYVAEEKAKAAQAPALWSELKDQLQWQVSQLASALGESDAIMFADDGDNFRVTAKGGAESTATFNSHRMEVSCVLVSTGKTYQVKIVRGEIGLVERGEGAIIKPRELAQELISALEKFI
jgi:hypothetical protein